ncbi:MAG TPA: hypothetical protein VII66_12340 [Gemmatimonadaceae bacterium]
MIYFVVGAAGSFSIRYYLEEEGRALRDRVRVILYEELARLRELPLGTWVFAEIDQLGPPERELVDIVCEHLGAATAGVRVLNQPRQVRLRTELLHAASDAGINRFRAWPAPSVRLATAERASRDADGVAAAALRYPVFVRYANRHVGSLTPLLDSPRALGEALASLVAGQCRLDGLLVVEFCDTKDEHGIYQKYSAFNVGDRILPRCLECSHDWMVKWHHRIFDRERAELEAHYLRTNPHEAWIREMFSLAGIEYGRIDYGVLGGEPQMWEINLNPTIGRGPGPRVPQSTDIVAYKQMLAPEFGAFYAAFQDAWVAIDSAADCANVVELPVSRGLRRAVESAVRQRRRAARVGALVDAIARQRWLRPVTRSVKGVLYRVAGARLRLGR